MLKCAAVALLAVGVLGTQPAHALEADQLFDRVSPSVVVVLAINGKDASQGSGIVSGPQRVVTNCHVVIHRNQLLVKRGQSQYPATLAYADEDRDLCLLSVPGLQAPAVDLRRLENVRVGQRVYAIGNPEGLELTLTEGLVSAIRSVRGRQMIQTSASFTHGSSGGGLFDAQGRLVGVTSSGIKEGLGLNFAIPADYVSEIMARIDAAAKPKPPEKPPEPTPAPKTIAASEPAPFPHTLSGEEIVYHFRPNIRIDATQQNLAFVIKILSASNVEHTCISCPMRGFGAGKMKIMKDTGLVCLDWDYYYPTSGCFEVVQTDTRKFFLRLPNREKSIMEYSIRR